jgi:hypothetical protein
MSVEYDFPGDSISTSPREESIQDMEYATQYYPGPADYKKCKIDIDEFGMHIQNLGKSFTSVRKINDLLEIVMTDDFYRKVINITNLIDSYKFSNAQCVIDGAPNNTNAINKIGYCKDLQKLQNHININRINDVVDKYESIIKKLLEKIYVVINDSQKYCDLDQKLSENVRRLSSKIGLLLADDSDLKKRCTNNYKNDIKAEVCSDIIPASVSTCSSYKSETCKDITASVTTCIPYKSETCKDITASVATCSQFKQNICEDLMFGHAFDKKGYFMGYILIAIVIICIVIIIIMLGSSKKCEKIMDD